MVLITAAVVLMTSNVASLHAQDRPVSSYAEDRAAIEDLQARYLFALDFHDPDLYVSTFTQDGVLDYGSGEVKGTRSNQGRDCRDAEAGGNGGTSTRGSRHNISNIVIRIENNRAYGASYWFHYSNDNPPALGCL